MSDLSIQFNIGRLFKTTTPIHREYAGLKGSTIVIEGLIGVGKSTLCESLHDHLTIRGYDVAWFPEEIPKSLLSLYTTDMNRYAFPFQVIVAQNRRNVLVEAQKRARSGSIVILDRCLLGDYTFAQMQKEKGFFTEKEFEAYIGLISTDLPAPTMTVFLDCSPEIAFQRMTRRRRPEEIDGYRMDYFEELDSTYRRVLANYEGTIYGIVAGLASLRGRLGRAGPAVS